MGPFKGDLNNCTLLSKIHNDEEIAKRGFFVFSTIVGAMTERTCILYCKVDTVSGVQEWTGEFFYKDNDNILKQFLPGFSIVRHLYHHSPPPINLEARWE